MRGRSPQAKYGKGVSRASACLCLCRVLLLDGSRGHQIPQSQAFQEEIKDLKLFFPYLSVECFVQIP